MKISTIFKTLQNSWNMKKPSLPIRNNILWQPGHLLKNRGLDPWLSVSTSRQVWLYRDFFVLQLSRKHKSLGCQPILIFSNKLVFIILIAIDDSARWSVLFIFLHYLEGLELTVYWDSYCPYKIRIMGKEAFPHSLKWIFWGSWIWIVFSGLFV